jgi:hypothetical protein
MISASIIHNLFAMRSSSVLGIFSRSISTTFWVWFVQSSLQNFFPTWHIRSMSLTALQVLHGDYEFSAMWQHWFPTKAMLSQPPVIPDI